jgi:hypothetical protein
MKLRLHLSLLPSQTISWLGSQPQGFGNFHFCLESSSGSLIHSLPPIHTHV